MKSKKWLWLRRGLLCAVVLGLLAAGLTVYLLKRSPEVWQRAQHVMETTTPQERAEMVEDVRQRLSALIEDEAPAGSRPGEPGFDSDIPASERHVDRIVDLQMSNDELVAMASEMFADWTVQRGFVVPGGITEPVIIADNGRLAFAFEISSRTWSQVFSGYLELTFSDSGMAHGRAEDLTAGSLPISITGIGEMLRKELPANDASRADQIGSWLSRLEGFTFRPVLEFENRRRGRILSVTPGIEGVTVRMRVQDHETYRRHNTLMDTGQLTVNDTVAPLAPPTPVDPPNPFLDGSAIADVPTTTD